MKRLVIPLFIPLRNNEIDYISLKYIINDINDCIVLIGNYDINKLNTVDKINVYLYLNIINPSNKYFIDENIIDLLINSYVMNKKEDVVSYLGNIIPNEMYEYMLNLELDVVDESLNEYISLFEKELINNKRNKIEYILQKKRKIIINEYKNIDNLIGINEI